MFWHLFTSKVDKDLELLNQIIADDNLKMREKLQRPIRLATKSELIKLIALMIGASVFSQQGEKLWINEKEEKKVRNES